MARLIVQRGLELSIEPGSLIADKYRVESVLGIGGMGVVLAAVHTELEQRVAVKLMLPEAAQQSESVTRFMREGKAAARLRSEHVAKVYDVGRLETGEPYIVMEWLDGMDLGAVLRKRTRLSIREAVDYVVQACEAVAEAHALNIVHRDLKPANLFLTRDACGEPCIKVLDFGISKMRSFDAVTSGITASGSAIGSPLYMSPEQMTGAKGVDPRTDIWSLGCILFELAAGRPVWPADNPSELCAAVIARKAPHVQDFVPDAPDAFDEAVSRCLEKKANHRYPTVLAMVQAIAPHGSHRAQLSVSRVNAIIELRTPLGAVSGAASHAALASTSPAPPAGMTGTRLRRRSRTPLLIVGGVVACASIAGIVFLRGTQAVPLVTQEPAASTDRSASLLVGVTPSVTPSVPVPQPSLQPTPSSPPVAQAPAGASGIDPIRTSGKAAVQPPVAPVSPTKGHRPRTDWGGRE